MLKVSVWAQIRPSSAHVDILPDSVAARYDFYAKYLAPEKLYLHTDKKCIAPEKAERKE